MIQISIQVMTIRQIIKDKVYISKGKVIPLQVRCGPEGG